MKKVILKCKLKDPEAFEEKLSDIDLDFSPIYWQHDRIYVPRNYKKNSNYPRLIMRTEMRAVDQPANYSLILRRHIEDSGVDIVEETPIKDYKEMVNIILQLGFKLSTEVSRRRQDLRMNERTYIYLDKIDDLPDFYAKIETTLEDTDAIADASADLEKTFETLGETDIVKLPYFEI